MKPLKPSMTTSIGLGNVLCWRGSRATWALTNSSFSLVPGVQEWMEGVLRHLYKHVGWMGFMIMGGPGVDGVAVVRT